jgi:steroid delta-isomerase-like uncharacterized protein
MGRTDLERVLRDSNEAFNARDWDRFERLHAEAVTVHGPMNLEPTKGRAAHRAWAEMLVRAFPDLRVETNRVAVEGDWICDEATVVGTHQGPWRGPGQMELPPTGKKVRFPMTTWTRVDGSEIVEERAYYDLLSLMGQLLGVEDFLADFMSRAAAKS